MTTSRTNACAIQETELDNELADVLIAISVITKQLAKKITAKKCQRRTKKMYKNYGLTGETVNVYFTDKDSDPYPWQGQTVPVRITGEYENYLVGEVLPHYAPNALGLSKPYPITICKHDIQIGEMIINGGTIR